MRKSFVILLLSCSFRFLASNGDEFANDQVFLREALFPSAEGLPLLLVQVLQVVKRAIQVLGQHVLVEAAMSQTATRISASKVRIRTTGTVEVSSGRHVKNTAAHRKIDGHAIQAVVWEEVGRGEGAEDGGRRSFRKHLRLRGLETEIDQEDEEREKDDVDGRHGRFPRVDISG